MMPDSDDAYAEFTTSMSYKVSAVFQYSVGDCLVLLQPESRRQQRPGHLKQTMCKTASSAPLWDRCRAQLSSRRKPASSPISTRSVADSNGQRSTARRTLDTQAAPSSEPSASSSSDSIICRSRAIFPFGMLLTTTTRASGELCSVWHQGQMTRQRRSGM
jgi:hypothetical protein